ncbi:hypothetical protein GEV33_011441 [Tenebrio molitor]|uniref:Uncharacterized protein n=1 Tax=Tenebrio molitor TaxID=7067 RepID=A0A8J6HAS7_TENMO|nr:hypothetical protein GEV33_011441 [Tenebrio molitor]
MTHHLAVHNLTMKNLPPPGERWSGAVLDINWNREQKRRIQLDIIRSGTAVEAEFMESPVRFITRRMHSRVVNAAALITQLAGVFFAGHVRRGAINAIKGSLTNGPRDHDPRDSPENTSGWVSLHLTLPKFTNLKTYLQGTRKIHYQRIYLVDKNYFSTPLEDFIRDLSLAISDEDRPNPRCIFSVGVSVAGAAAASVRLVKRTPVQLEKDKLLLGYSRDCLVNNQELIPTELNEENGKPPSFRRIQNDDAVLIILRSSRTRAINFNRAIADAMKADCSGRKMHRQMGDSARERVVKELRYLPPDLIASDNKVFINILLGEFYGRKHKIQPHAIENTFIKKAQSYDGEDDDGFAPGRKEVKNLFGGRGRALHISGEKNVAARHLNRRVRDQSNKASCRSFRGRRSQDARIETAASGADCFIINRPIEKRSKRFEKSMPEKFAGKGFVANWVTAEKSPLRQISARKTTARQIGKQKKVAGVLFNCDESVDVVCLSLCLELELREVVGRGARSRGEIRALGDKCRREKNVSGATAVGLINAKQYGERRDAESVAIPCSRLRLSLSPRVGSVAAPPTDLSHRDTHQDKPQEPDANHGRSTERTSRSRDFSVADATFPWRRGCNADRAHEPAPGGIYRGEGAEKKIIRSRRAGSIGDLAKSGIYGMGPNGGFAKKNLMLAGRFKAQEGLDNRQCLHCAPETFNGG